MNFVKTLSTANFIITIISIGAGDSMVSIKPTTDTAKMYLKVKKVVKNEPVLVTDVLDYVNTLEGGVDALAKI